MSDQLELFAPRSPPRAAPRRDERVGPAAQAPELGALASALPARVRLGTSSWSFPGWSGLVYDRRATPARLAREGLAAYARHPLLRTVGIDRGYYAPLDRELFAAYASAVPAHFRFLAKAHELVTLARFPLHPRYGERRGQPNPRFLDPGYAAERIVAPFVSGLAAKAGPLVFQFPPQEPDAVGGPEAFAARLHDFLVALPSGVLYAVEIRSRAWLTPAYAEALASAGAAPCLSVHPRLPDLARQAELLVPALAGNDLVVRWMLGGGRGYQEARERYQPFDRLVDEDRQSRVAIAALCLEAAQAGRAAWVVVNNKAEGSAPLSILRLAEALASANSTDPAPDR